MVKLVRCKLLVNLVRLLVQLALQAWVNQELPVKLVCTGNKVACLVVQVLRSVQLVLCKLCRHLVLDNSSQAKLLVRRLCSLICPRINKLLQTLQKMQLFVKLKQLGSRLTQVQLVRVLMVVLAKLWLAQNAKRIYQAIYLIYKLKALNQLLIEQCRHNSLGLIQAYKVFRLDYKVYSKVQLALHKVCKGLDWGFKVLVLNKLVLQVQVRQLLHQVNQAVLNSKPTWRVWASSNRLVSNNKLTNRILSIRLSKTLLLNSSIRTCSCQQ